MDKGERSVSDNRAESFKMLERESLFTKTGVDPAGATGLILEKRRFKIRGLFTAMGISVRNVTPLSTEN
jgi:hypothetical protein